MRRATSAAVHVAEPTDPVVDIEGIAHGGHCIAHLDGQVVFVRHTLPGERVRIRITERTKRFLRADAVEVITAAPGRVTPPCRYAGECGGCDFQHISPEAQRGLLGDVVREQLRHLAGIDWVGEVEAVHPDDLGWRTRMTYAVRHDGHLGLRRHRSHDVIAIDECVIASDRLPAVLGQAWKADTVEAVGSSEGDQLVVLDGNRGKIPKLPGVSIVTAEGERLRGKASVTERVGEHAFRVSGSGFWQVHPEAASTLVDAVMTGLDVRQGDRVADLYAGVGLFTAFLAEAVGETGAVYSVESDPGGSRDARRNLHTHAQVTLVGEAVETALQDGALGDSLDLVVLDPPRTGAKQAVGPIAALRPRAIAYVACDPAALARDLASFAELGYRPTSIRSFDLFPMTQHVECVAVLVRD